MYHKLLRTLLLLSGVMTLALHLGAQTAYYVSPEGNDRAAGTAKRPFRSIGRAQLEARKVTRGDVTIYVHGGTYRLSEPLVFTPADGGKEKRLTVKAMPGERPVLSGAVTLRTDWKAYRDGIYMTRIEGTTEPVMDLLTVNGDLRYMARYPNYSPDATRFNGTSAEATDPQRVKRWKHPEGAYLHVMHISDWGSFHYRVTGATPEGELKLEGGWQNNRPSGLHKQNRMIENVFEELDAPGEWYYDHRERTLYYYPMRGEDLAQAAVESAQLKELVVMRGTEAEPVSNVHLEGLELTMTRRTFMEPYEPLLRSDWMIYRGGAILMTGTTDCSVTRCSLHNLGGNAIFLSDYNERAEVSGSHIRQVGASAICLVGSAEAVRSPAFTYRETVPADSLDHTLGAKGTDYPADCVIHDNLIHEIGLYEKQVAGVEISMSRGITVSHNTICHTPRAGINVSEGTWSGHVIEWNDVFDTVRETGDHGAFNAWGRDRFWSSDRQGMDRLVEEAPELILADAMYPTTLRYNRFRCDRGWDIDLDDGASNYLIYGNLCLNGGLKLREGFYRVVENNVLINNTFHPHVWFKHSGDVFARNIVMLPYRPIGMEHWGAEIDYNVFADSTALRQSHDRHTDAHSIVLTPTFVDPSTGDYRLTNVTEAARRCGFRNFPMDRFGVVSPTLRDIAPRPTFPTPRTSTAGNRSTTRQWAGLTIKNLETVGERSATGMDSERGVYVVTVSAFECPLHDYIRPNDVLLGMNGRAVNNLTQLAAALKGTDFTKAVKLTIFRDQHELTLTLPPHTLTGREPLR